MTEDEEMHPDEEAILTEQLAYYRARANEYDEWFFRIGRYDRGEEHTRRWFTEVKVVEEALAAAHPSGDVLELACGTGIWTKRLAPMAASLTCVDASSEVIAINQKRVRDPKIRYVEADLFHWQPPGTYDFAFFGFWLSHVPDSQFERFWSFLRRALRPDGRVFFVDSLATSESTAKDQRVDRSGIVERHLNDGRSFRIVKVFHRADDLTRRLSDLRWETAIRETPSFFIYGSAAARATVSD